MSIPLRFIEELRSRITVSDVLGKRMKLTRAGREYKGCCPFHHEKTPSFYVNDDKQFFHCFGCGAHGTIIDFVMRYDNLSFPEAVESLASSVGMQVPKSAPEDVEKAKREKSLYSLMDDAAKWMEQQLRSAAHKTPYQYIRERGLHDDVLNAFRVGYAPSDMQVMRKYLLSLGYTDAQMIEAALLKASDKGKDPYAFFRERVMFPVTDRRGRIVAFGGRVLPEHLREPSRGDFTPPKYLNSSDTPLFHKGKMLYGEAHARQAANDGQPIIVVEGYMDVIACWTHGFKGAVAPLGTALTEDQIQVLWKMIPSDTKIPILCFDGDSAGRRAASRACERLLPLIKPNHSAKIAFLPEGEDPDSLTKSKGRDALAAILDNAMNLVDFYYFDETDGKIFDTPELRAGLSKTLDDIAARITDRTVQHYYREAFRDKIRQAFAQAKSVVDGRGTYESRPQKTSAFSGRSMAGGRFSPQPVLQPVVPLRRPSFSKSNYHLRTMLACVINNPVVFQEVEEAMGRLDFSQSEYVALAQKTVLILSSAPDLEADALCAMLQEAGFVRELTTLLSEETYVYGSYAKRNQDVEAALQGWRGTLDIIQNQQLDYEIERASQALRMDPTPENEARLRALEENKQRGGA